jgi:hypothetical protein
MLLPYKNTLLFKIAHCVRYPSDKWSPGVQHESYEEKALNFKGTVSKEVFF